MHTTSRGFDIAYRVEGSGPVVFLVPGILQSAVRWVEAGYVDALRDHFRVVAVDPLGHGESDKPHDAASYRQVDLATDLLAVLDAEGVDRAHMWGFSLGGQHVATVAALWPERVLTLTIGSTVVSYPGEVKAQFGAPWVPALRAGAWGEFWELFGLADERVRADLEAANDPMALAAMVEGCLDYDIPVARITAPGLLYIGSEEVLAPAMPAEAEALHAQLHVLEGRNHTGTFFAHSEVLEFVRPHLAGA